MTFATNGSMSRHLKTAHRASTPSHHQRVQSPSGNSCTDSDGSNDSERILQRKLIQEEFNNNEIAKRHSPELLAKYKSGKRKYQDYGEAEPENHVIRQKLFARTPKPGDFKINFTELYKCQVCGRHDFENIEQFETHADKLHPEYTPRCDSCDLNFKNHRELCFHRLTIHVHHNPLNYNQNSIVGFKDLTFVDFSSVKFPAIARAVCEQSLHRPAADDISYQCSKCLRAFPCQSALDAHETECGLPQINLRLSDDQSYRNHFFAGLDLQDKAALTEAKEGKDLADIQSILSVTSGPILHNFSRTDPTTPDHCLSKNKYNVESSGSSGTPSSESHEEEAQDPCIDEIRKWKQKGEFPCRLCHQTYPNLRALKGHNRMHTSEDSGVPYPCNVCTYTGPDRATLMKHMKSHSGDRPYECSLCKFGFTTKANCERHVRKRHFKLTREEIKSVMIYNASEDPTNNSNIEKNLKESYAKDEVRKTLVYPNERENHNILHQNNVDVKIKEDLKLRQVIPNFPADSSFEKLNIFPKPPAARILELPFKNQENREKSQWINSKHDDDLESRSSEDSASLVGDAKTEQYQSIQAGPIDLKKSTSVKSSADKDDDAPLDLSMDVLDLSKKSKEKDNDINGNNAEGSLNSTDFINARNQLLLTQALLKSGQAAGQHPINAMYANAQMMYGNFGAFPAVGAGLLQQYMFNPHLFSQEFALKERFQKELVRGLQTSGGNLVDQPISGFNTPTFNALRSPNSNANANESNGPVPAISTPQVPAKRPPAREKTETPATSSGSVKMVIKNGVLMPRQKQRRYRTERPFMCGHCTAKFTLRSNMERHIKQQHPQHWSQRPRGGYSTRGRPPANPPTLLHSIQEQTNSQASQHDSERTSSLGSVNDLPRQDFNDQVKFAILAQQLKEAKAEDNESDEELVIDEGKGVKESVNNVPIEATERTLSLLRGKLEAIANNKEVKKIEIPIEEEKVVNLKVKVEKNEVIEDNVIEAKLKNDEISEAASKTEIKSEIAEDLSGTTSDESLEIKKEKNEAEDLASVSEILDNASQKYQQFHSQYLSDEDVVASTSDCNPSTDETSDCAHSNNTMSKKKRRTKKSAYSMAPNRVICPYCDRPFPWNSSLRRHVLTHTGQKPFQCKFCNLPFTTKSNRDRHMLRKHKANANKLRQSRRTSSPEVQDNVSTTNNFSIRNVPERPYKCNQCPSSTFSTLGNLKKHRSVKHPQNGEKYEEECPSSDAQNSPQDCSKQNDQSGYESQSSSNSENLESSSAVAHTSTSTANTSNASSSATETSRSRKTSPRSSPGPSDAPFKCHLCDSGFAVRQDCQEHIKNNHKSSYEMLVAKGAMEMNNDVIDDVPPPQPTHSSDGEEKRGRFPDYSNRKVVCAFCMRRFWSAEDLRRHMRTHTGERPFFCDICSRRFTLKHSMLRHRKKHGYAGSSMYVGCTSGDEDSGITIPSNGLPNGPSSTPSQLPTATPRSSHHQQQLCNGQMRTSLPQTAAIATGDAAPNGLSIRYNPYERLVALRRPSPPRDLLQSPPPQPEEDDVNLISNLLGLSNSVVKEAMSAPSPDLAAQMIGAP